MSKAIIGNIKENSIAYELGLYKDDKVLKINDKPVGDIIDYIIEISGDYVELVVEKTNGELFLFEIEKDFNEELGIQFNPPTITPIKTCQNNCKFCFINQMPPGLRNSLYVKDDDYRMSFLTGNYITGTNLKDEDIERIINYNLSPLYISVHQTDENRDVLMGRTKKFSIMKLLEKFKNGGVSFHTQIVLVPGYNDGEVLKSTLKELISLKPYILSVAIVPVGLTKYRDNLPQIDQVNKDVAKQTIKIVNDINERCENNIIFVSDEIYLKAQENIPNKEYYNDYSQLENGIGMLRLFMDEFDIALAKFENKIINCNFENKYIIITSELTCDYMKTLLKKIQGINDQFQYKVIEIKNNFFGDSVNVTGLLVGNDILNIISSKNDCISKNDIIMLPENTLDFDNEKFLDGLTFEQFNKKIENKVVITEIDGKSFIKTILKEGGCK